MIHDDDILLKADRKLGLRFSDQCRLRSHMVTRPFSSAIRASSEGSQSELLEPDEVMLLESDADMF